MAAGLLEREVDAPAARPPAAADRGRRRPSPTWLVVLLVCLVVALSNAFGRAEPTGRYRPELPPNALETGCFPLPGGVELGFPHQVRSDGEIDGRRRLVLHFDLVSAGEARTRLVDAFAGAGFREVGPRDPARADLVGPGGVRVGAEVSAFDVPEDNIVRGLIALDLPITAPASGDPVCADPASTKRFASGPGSVA